MNTAQDMLVTIAREAEADIGLLQTLLTGATPAEGAIVRNMLTMNHHIGDVMHHAVALMTPAVSYEGSVAVPAHKSL